MFGSARDFHQRHYDFHYERPSESRTRPSDDGRLVDVVETLYYIFDVRCGAVGCVGTLEKRSHTTKEIRIKKKQKQLTFIFHL